MNRRNPWRYWKPVYGFTWALFQRSSYRHFSDFTRSAPVGKLVIDVGTGTGEYIKYVSPANRYIFTDIDSQAIRCAADAARASLPEGSWSVRIGDARHVMEALPHADLISVIHVISVVDDPASVIDLALQRLNPSGVLLIYISKLSKPLRYLGDSIFRPLGFRLLDVEAYLPRFHRESAGWLNYCYIVRKH